MGRFFSPAVLASTSPQVASARRTLLSTESGRLRRLLRGDPGHGSDARSCRRFACRRSSSAAISTSGCRGTSHGERARRTRSPARARCGCRRRTSPISSGRDRSAPRCSSSWCRGPPRSREAGLRGPARGRSATTTSIARSPATTEFTRDFQELITSYAWGTIWTRPGLDHRTRRLLVLDDDRRARPLGRVPAARPHRPRP